MTFSYVRNIPIPATSGVPSNYQVKITLNNTNFDFSKVESTGIDFYFTASDGVTPLPFWREDFDATAETATFWVLVPTISDSEATVIKMFYGDEVASDLSDIDAVMEFADEFNVWDSSKWIVSSGSPSVADGHLFLGTGDPGGVIYSNLEFSGNLAISMGAANSGNSVDYTQGGFSLNGLVSIYLRPTGQEFRLYDTDGNMITPQTWVANVYHNVELRVDGTSWEGQIDDGTVQSVTTTASGVPEGPIYLRNEKWDYVYIRKYVTTEPTASVGEETLSTGDSIYAGYVLLSNVNYKEFSVTGNGETTVFALPHENIFSFVKVMNGETELVEDTDYTIDRFNGSITFSTAIPDGTTYNIIYLYGYVQTVGSGVTVNLLNASGTVVDTTTTDYAGKFQFTVSTAGNYKMQAVTDLFDNYVEVIKG